GKRGAVLRQERTPIGLARLRQLRDKLCPQLHRQAECYREAIVPALATHGVVLRSWEELTVGQREEARRYFESNISPALTPLVIDPDHPLPFLPNLSTSPIFPPTCPRRASSGSGNRGQRKSGLAGPRRGAASRHGSL